MAKKVPYSTVLFASISNFSEFLNSVEYEEAMWVLNDIVCEFDELCDKYNVEKIKTNGPYYMAVVGLEAEEKLSGEKAANGLFFSSSLSFFSFRLVSTRFVTGVAKFALAMMKTMERFNHEKGHSFTLRVGLNHGPCVSGVIGKKKFCFDIWGDSVNVASRMVTLLFQSSSFLPSFFSSFLSVFFFFFLTGVHQYPRKNSAHQAHSRDAAGRF